MKPDALTYADALALELKERYGFEEPNGKNFIGEWMLNFDIAIHEAEYEEVKNMHAAFFQMRDQLFVFARWSNGTPFNMAQMDGALIAARILVTALPSSFAGKVVIDKIELDELRALRTKAEAETSRTANLTAGGAHDKPSYLAAVTKLIAELSRQYDIEISGREQITMENAFFDWSLKLERALRAKWEAEMLTKLATPNRIEPSEPWPRQ